MKKRFLSILATLCLCLTLLPVAVFAEGETDVSINETNFPDANFRTVVKEYDADNDENLSRVEIEAVKEIKCYHKDIRSLTGIEYFTALQTLKCYSNQLTSLDISGNTALESLDCADNQLTTLDVSRNTALKSLDCAKNQLTTLDVSRNTALESLNCADNQVTSLDISQNTALECLICASNKLTALNVSGNATLKFLNCESNELTALDVNRNTALNTLNCLNNRLTSLNVSLNLNLQDLNCARNQLSALDVQKNTALKSLYCGYNQLAVLDVGQNGLLESLSCNNNLLTSLNVSQNTRLNLLHCFNNHLTSLDTSNQRWLHTLSCNNNNYPITITNDRNYDLSDLPGTFDVNKASNWSGGTVSGNILTVDHDKDGVSYTYDCGNGRTANFTLTVENKVEEQFTLTPGGRYYFDLSAMDIPGTVNTGNIFGATSLPDTTLHYVPFTYAGTVNAYKLTTETATTEEYAQKNKYPHSLFVADYAVTNDVSWDALNTADLIFGKNYASGGVDYTLRTPSAGSDCTGLDDSKRGVPKSNEWDTMLNKDSGYIQNWNGMFSWGQDVSSGGTSYRAVRGYFSARFWSDKLAANYSFPYVGFRPVLEVLNPDTLSSDSLKAVTLDLNGGKLGGSSEDIQIIVKSGSTFTAPASGGLTRPDGDTGSYFKWLGSDGNLYAPGDRVPADVTALTVQWTAPTYAVTLNTNGGTINNGNVTGYTYGVGATLPTADDMTYTGYMFKGWYDNENLTGSPVTAIGGTETGNKEYWAKWEINQYTITFDANGGSEIAPITQNYGTKITAPADPTRKGYTFKGWDKEIPKTMPAENMTVKAQWEINQYTITFDTNGGSEIAPITQDYGTAITAPADPIRKGYTFKGWDKEIPETMPAENITITARWRDTEKPTGEIIIGTNKWNKFLNELTFGIFFKDTQEVTINAVDNSGTVFVSYLVTDKDLSEAELDSLVFRAYEEPFCIDPNGEYIVYVMLVDENINITYLRSDRLTLDNIHPVIGGIENGKTYCEAQTVTITEKYVDTVTVNGTAVTLDENNSFTLAPADGEQKIVVTDKAGNTADMTVTVNDGHTFGEWTSNGDGTHTRQCTADGCTEGIETGNCVDEDKNHICDICGNIISNHEDANQDHVCDLCGKVISNHEDADKDHVCDHCGKVISNHEDANKDHVCDYCEKVISNHEDADKDHICDYCGKVITNHIGGKETCRDKAVCEVCGKSYGKLDPKNHTDLKHFPAKAATEDADGNIEYWYCSGCNKYYSDKDGTKEIAKADTVTAKLPKSPPTGDTSNLMLWIALLFVSGGVLTGVTVFDKRKRHSVK